MVTCIGSDKGWDLSVSVYVYNEDPWLRLDHQVYNCEIGEFDSQTGMCVAFLSKIFYVVAAKWYQLLLFPWRTSVA